MMSDRGAGRSCTFRNASVPFGNFDVHQTGGMTVRRLLAAVMVLGLAAMAPSAQARDATVRSFDQTAINTHFFPAAGLAPRQPAPPLRGRAGRGPAGGDRPPPPPGGAF